MVEYIKPVRPNAAPVAMRDSYYRPLLDNTESRALEKLAGAIGALRGPIRELSNTALQGRQNQLQMMRMEQNLQLKQEENAFRLYKMEQDLITQQARENYNNFNDALKATQEEFRNQMELDMLRLEQGLPILGTSVFSGTGMGKVTMANEGAIRNDPLDDQLYDILSSAASQVGVEVRVFSGGQEAAGEGGDRTGTTRHDHGRAADLRLYDTATGRMIPVDGSDQRAVDFAHVARSLGARGIGGGDGYMGGTALHVDIVGTGDGGGNYWGKKGGTPYAWIPALFDRDPAQDIKEYGAAESVQYVNDLNARRMSAINQLAADYGINEEGRRKVLEAQARDNAYALERAKILTEGARRQVLVQDYEQDRQITAQQLTDRIEQMSEQELMALVDSGQLHEFVARELANSGVANGHANDIIAQTNTSDYISDSSPIKTALKRYGEATQSLQRDTAFANVIQYTLDAAKMGSGGPLNPTTMTDAEVAEVFEEQVARSGLGMDEVLTSFVDQVDLAQGKAAAQGATNDNIEAAANVTALMNALYQHGAFDNASPDVQDKVAGLVKDKDASGAGFGDIIKMFNNTLKQIPDGATDSATYFANYKLFEQRMNAVFNQMDPVEQGQYIDLQTRTTGRLNEAQDAYLADPGTPVTGTGVEYIYNNGEVQQREVFYNQSDQNEQVTSKQAAAVRSTLLPAVEQIQTGDGQKGRMALRDGLATAARNGYGAGLMAGLVNEVIGGQGGVVDTDTIETVTAIVAASRETGNPYVDFAGDPGLQIMSMMPGSFADNFRDFGRAVVQQDIIQEDQINQIADAVGYVGANDNRFEALQLIANSLPRLLANPDPVKVQEQVDRLTKKAGTNRLYSFQGEGGVLSSMPILGMTSGAQVNVLGSTANKELVQSRYGLSDRDFKEVARLATELGLQVANQSGVTLNNSEQRMSYIEFTANADGINMHRRDKDRLLFDSPRGLAALADRRTTPSGPIPMTPATFAREFDTSKEGQTTHFVLDGLGAQTYDIRNTRGSLTVVATFADGTSQDFNVSPEEFLAIPTDGRNLGPDHGNIAYMLPYADKYSNATSIELVINGAVGYSPVGSTDLNSTHFSWDTLVAAYRMGERDEVLTLLGGE